MTKRYQIVGRSIIDGRRYGFDTDDWEDAKRKFTSLTNDPLYGAVELRQFEEKTPQYRIVFSFMRG